LKILQEKIQAQRHKVSTMERAPDADVRKRSFLGKMLGK
jgi:hypothetical protein